MTDSPFTELAPARYLRIDLFPAAVLGPDVTPERAVRVVVTDAHYYLFVDAPGGVLTVARSGGLYSFEGDNRTGYVITDEESGDTYTFKRSLGCGCGSRLRGIRPFPGTPHQAALDSVL